MTNDHSNVSKRQGRRLIWGLAAVAVAVAGGGLAYFGMCGTCHVAKPNVFIILIDTLRAGHLGVYGYQRNTSPAIDAFAKDALVMRRAVTAAPWTPSAVASLFSGLYVTGHGWQPPMKRSDFSKTGIRLSSGIDTLAERLKRAGYVNGAISPNPWITPEFGFDQGFDGFWTHNRADAENMTKRAKSAIKMLRSPDKPLFLYVHYLDPHDPYKPPAQYRTMFEGSPPGGNYPEHVHRSMNLYDGEIRYTDDMVGDFLNHLKAEGLYENSVIIIVADHGEQFYERGDLGHGHQLFNEETHIPFLVKFPHSATKGSLETTVSTVDILPTILNVAGIKVPEVEKLPGSSLLDEGALAGREGVLSEIRRDYSQKSFVTADGKKLIFGTKSQIDEGKPEVDAIVGQFDLKTDPREATPLSDAESAETLKEKLAHALSIALESKVAPDKEGAGTAIGEETLKQLKSLGYIQ